MEVVDERPQAAGANDMENSSSLNAWSMASGKSDAEHLTNSTVSGTSTTNAKSLSAKIPRRLRRHQ